MKMAILGNTDSRPLTAEDLIAAMDKLKQSTKPTRLFFTTSSTVFPDSYAPEISEILGNTIDVYDREGKKFVGGKQVGKIKTFDRTEGDNL